MLRRFLAVVLAFLFLTLTPISLLALGVQTLLLDPRYYKQQLVELGIYEKAYAELVPAIAQSIEIPEGVPLTDQDIETLVRRVVPESFVRAQTERMVDELFAVMMSRKDRVELVVPLAEVKQRIPDEVARLIDERLTTVPPCPGPAPPLPDQLQGLFGDPGEPVRLPTCLPSGAAGDRLRSVFRAGIDAEVRRQVNTLPDSVDLAVQIKGIEEARSSLEPTRRVMSSFVPVAQILYVLLVVLVIVVGILGGNSFNSGVGWAGLTLLASGVAVLFITLWINFAVLDAVDEYTRVLGAPRDFEPVVSGLITSICSDLVHRIQIEAGGVAVLGALLLYVSRRI